MQGVSPFWDLGGNAGWTVQAGMFPGMMSFGWSNMPRTQGVGGTLPPGVTQEEAQEQARVQQRNALITFVVLIVLFALMTTLSEMDLE